MRDLVSHNTYKFWFISEYVELVRISKILGRVDFDTVTICPWRCRENRIKMRVIPESQTFLLDLETAEVPQYLLKARTVTEQFWYKNQIPGETSMA
jgi:hypothetical protein